MKHFEHLYILCRIRPHNQRSSGQPWSNSHTELILSNRVTCKFANRIKTETKINKGGNDNKLLTANIKVHIIVEYSNPVIPVVIRPTGKLSVLYYGHIKNAEIKKAAIQTYKSSLGQWSLGLRILKVLDSGSGTESSKSSESEVMSQEALRRL